LFFEFLTLFGKYFKQLDDFNKKEYVKIHTTHKRLKTMGKVVQSLELKLDEDLLDF